MNEDRVLLDRVIGQLNHAWNHGYYLDEKDIADAILLIYKASEYGIGKDDLIAIVAKTLNNYV